METQTNKKNRTDIINLLLEDHKPLKKLLKIMKDPETDIEERREALEKFGPLLLAHAQAEEGTLYTHMKEEDDLRMEGFEGDVEHALAAQTLEEADQTDDEDLWSARTKVLAELVEHHIKEEEDEIFPDFKKATDLEERKDLGEEYLEAKKVEEDVEA